MTRSVLSVSALALCAGVVLGSAAFAQSPSVLQPRGGWSVTKMDQPSNGSTPYCALARQYDKDIIFTLGRNVTDEFSLAVDFQKEQMDPETAYKLTLSPGAGQVRAFDLMPLSSRAMVIRLGWDDSFFKALESSRSLRVGIGDVDYSFNMPDIAAGQKDLTSCVEGLKAAAKDHKTADADGDTASPQVDVLNAEAGGAAGFSARKGAPAESRTASAGAVAGQRNMSPPPKGMKDGDVELVDAVPAPAVQSMSVSSNAKQGDLLAQMAQLRSENSKLSRALEKQREELKESYKNAQDANTVAEMKEKIRLLEQENKRLGAGGEAGTVTAQSGAKAEVTPDQIKAMQQQVKDLQKENADLQQKLAMAVENTDKRAPTEASPGVAVQLEALQKQLDLAQSEKKNLQAEVEELRRSNEDQQVADAQAKGDVALEKAVRRYNEAEREIKRLGSLLEQERKARLPGDVGGEKQAQRVALLEKELEKVRAEQASIGSAEKKKAEDTAKQLADVQKQMKGLQKEKANLETELSQVKTALASARQTAAVEEDKSDVVESLKAQLAEAQKQQKVLSEQSTMYKTELEKVNQNLLQAQTQLGGNQDASKALQQAQAENRQYQVKLAALEEEIEKLQASVAMNAYRPEEQLNGAEPAAGHEPPPLQPAAKPVQQASYGKGDVQGLLQRAGFAPQQGSIQSAGQGAYQWQAAGGMTGKAKITAAAPGFARLVDQHLNGLKSQCKGDFAAIPSAQGTNSANFEVACVGGSGGQSSSIAFFEQKGNFVAIALETTPENMEMAMDARDRIAQVR